MRFGQVRAGDSLEISIGVANDGWLLAWAKDVRVHFLLPEGFTNSRTGTNECELNFFTLHGGDGLGGGLIITVSNTISPGNYIITLKLYGENVPENMTVTNMSAAMRIKAFLIVSISLHHISPV